MRARFLHFCLAGLLLIAGAGSAQAGDFSVAFVQASRLLNESPQIQQLKARVSEEFAERDVRLIEMQKQIKLLEDKLAQEGRFMNSDEQRRLNHDISTRRLKYEHARAELNQDKQLRYTEEEERMTRIIREVIGEVAQDEKIDIVLQSGVLWYSDRVDVTDKVLARLQQMADGESPR